MADIFLEKTHKVAGDIFRFFTSRQKWRDDISANFEEHSDGGSDLPIPTCSVPTVVHYSRLSFTIILLS